MTDRLKQIENRVNAEAFVLHGDEDILWILSQLRGAEQEINMAIRELCLGCVVSDSVERRDANDWIHPDPLPDHDLICDASGARERRYQRIRG